MSKLRNRYQESRITIKRLSLVLVCFIMIYGVLIVRLYNLQISKYKQYLSLSEKNKNREIYLAPFRADILDRNGNPLATYNTRLILTLEETLTESDKAILLSKGIQLTDKNQYTITQEQFAYLSNYTASGISLKALPYRYYPLASSAAHLVGYTGPMHQSDYSYLEKPLEGKSGIERLYQNELFGKPGLQRQHKNAKGELFNTNILREPERAPSIELSIDAQLQDYIHDLMLGYVGAAIVLNPNNGELLAAVSSPSFNPNFISNHDYNKRLEVSNKPMFNRLVQALYPPGSIVKPFIALGAMDEGLLDPNALIEDPGHFQLNENSRIFHDHKRTGHGKVNLHRAIAVSCDTYFYHLAQKIGIDRIVKYLQHYKLGEKTNIEMLGEIKGILPTKAYRQKNYKKWYQGQTIITAIGQGDILFSPLQLARATMLLANKGYDYPLTFIKGSNGEPSVITINEEHRALIIKAMEDVLKTGTGRKIGKKPYSIAAKTSTVQVVQIENPAQYQKLPEHQKDHHMIIAFAPSEKAEVVIVVVVEHRHEGLLAEKILDWCYNAGYITKIDDNVKAS